MLAARTRKREPAMKRMVLLLLAPGLFYLLLVALELLPPSTSERAAAVALLQQPNQRAVGEHDGFARLWSWQHEVPEAELQAVLAADSQQFQRHIDSGADGAPRFDARKPYRELGYDAQALCPPAPASCLEHVRAAPEASAAALTDQAPLLQRLQGMHQADHIRYGFTAAMDSPLPPLQGIAALTATANAQAFASGQVEDAVAASCRDLATWRRLRSRTDALVVDMVGIAIAAQHAQLLAEMLAELPPQQALPVDCELALAPPSAGELDQCDDWRGEYRLMQNAVRDHLPRSAASEGSRLPGAVVKLAVNERATLERLALPLAALCGASIDPVAAGPGWMDWVFDPFGTQLGEIAQPDFGQYRARAEDFLQLLQGLRLARWLGTQADPAAAFAARPADYRGFDQGLQLADDGSAVLLHWRAPPRSSAPADWALPIAGSRRPATP